MLTIFSDVDLVEQLSKSLSINTKTTRRYIRCKDFPPAQYATPGGQKYWDDLGLMDAQQWFREGLQSGRIPA